MMEILFWLLVGHAVADFALQSSEMAKGKNRNNKTTPPLGAKYVPCWPYWLTAHSGIHAGAVALATGNIYLGMAEWICHWLIDFGKCDNRYGVHADQALHVGCKLVWLALLLGGYA